VGVVAVATGHLEVRAEALLVLAGLTQTHMLVVAGLQTKASMVLSVVITHIMVELEAEAEAVVTPELVKQGELVLYPHSLGLLFIMAVAVAVRVITLMVAAVVGVVVLAAVELVLVGITQLLQVQQIQVVRVAALIRGKELPQLVVLV
jgi:hypothetical protein